MRLPLFAAAAVACLLGGAAPAQATVFYFEAFLSGPAESPPNASPGIGFTTLLWDDVLHSATLDVAFSGLTGTTTASHIHSATAVPGTGTAGVATQLPTFIGFPLGVTSGTYHNVFATNDAAFYNPAFVTANGGTVASAETALLNGIIAGRAYLNIHTSTFGGGEIRGFLAAPEPSAWALMIGGFAMAGAALRRRRPARVSG